jgi:methionyl aminopeptidase
VIEALREAGRIAAAARESGLRRIVPGALVREVCVAVEAEIHRMGGALAFPVQSSRNDVAAHYCPSPEDQSAYAAGDLAKLDVGVHVDGWVVDTAATVNVGDRPEGRGAVGTARAALDAAIAAARPGAPIRALSQAIQATALAQGLRPVRNICGHGVGRYTVHCRPQVPNLPDDQPDTLERGLAVAIEPFVTDGGGLVAEAGRAEVFRLIPERAEGPVSWAQIPAELMDAIRAFRGLPFARRQLASFPRAELERALTWLGSQGALGAYAPLVETTGRPVAQAEHTIYVHEDRIEVLTA